jgi:hypothetical protein
MEDDKAAKDSPEAYEATYRRCPKNEWLTEP